jgi:D-alanyl-D-alanine carboxypeptidase/D-alanyl-D-alanine-endopeptidase (penicillin-binding protein 4)
MKIFYALAVLLLFSSCSSTHSFFLSKNKKIIKSLDNSGILQNEFTGFVLYDINKDKYIVDYNGNKFFTPASNTKLFTFYTSLNVLKDSLPLIKYVLKNDSLIFWGTGNPLTMNPDFTNNKYTIDFLKKYSRNLFYCQDNFQDEKFGSGWAWDDYLYYYQLEKNPFPVYGNRLRISFFNDSISINPRFLVDNISYISDSFEYWRPWDKNNFVIGKFEDSTIVDIPVVTEDNFIKRALEYNTGKVIYDCLDSNSDKTEVLQIPFPDSIYLRLLHQSDNFIAEQLMLMCSFKLFDTINTKKAIKWSKDNLLPQLHNNCRWVDGSGLSRYNLFSPEDMVYVLKNIYKKLSWKQITYYLPSPGYSGTLKNSYKSIKTPYIWAKSGSLSNNYNLSGFIQTRKGNRYIFSFMNNHFLHKYKDIKKEMEKIFIYIYEEM